MRTVRWECDRCGRRIFRNVSECPSCEHTVFSPVDDTSENTSPQPSEPTDGQYTPLHGGFDRPEFQSSEDVNSNIGNSGMFATVRRRLRLMWLRIRSVLMTPLRWNAAFLAWWQQKLNNWSRLREKGFRWWIVWELTWPLMAVCLVLYYLYLLPWIAIGYIYEYWWFALIILMLIVAIGTGQVSTEPLLGSLGRQLDQMIRDLVPILL